MLKFLEGKACIAHRESAWMPKAPSEPFKARRWWDNILVRLTRKTIPEPTPCELRILYPAKVPLKSKGEVKTFTQRRKLR